MLTFARRGSSFNRYLRRFRDGSCDWLWRAIRWCWLFLLQGRRHIRLFLHCCNSCACAHFSRPLGGTVQGEKEDQSTEAVNPARIQLEACCKQLDGHRRWKHHCFARECMMKFANSGALCWMRASRQTTTWQISTECQAASNRGPKGL